ncbi:hypothetical protein HanIR_Chr04g0205901 [Helianthus annuus]|nr:hypothetical protein HanIR_Chr04g0205901 [Helianthus annuus]
MGAKDPKLDESSRSHSDESLSFVLSLSCTWCLVFVSLYLLIVSCILAL